MHDVGQLGVSQCGSEIAGTKPCFYQMSNSIALAAPCSLDSMPSALVLDYAHRGTWRLAKWAGGGRLTLIGSGNSGTLESINAAVNS